jgi:hypothetical protein
VVQPPEEFIAALNRLAPDDEEDEEESPAEQ